MKRNILQPTLMLFVAFLTACAPAATAAPTQESLPLSQPTQPAEALPFHPLDTMTNMAEIDVIIRAVASGDPQQVRDLFEYTQTACMTVNALGGPPACREGEVEGTIVEVLPSLGPEGSFLHKEDAQNFPGLNAIGLYAVYNVPASAFSDENYPAGDYGIAYLTGENIPEVILQVTDGKIVRIDYVFGFQESNQIVPENVTDFVVEPLSK